MKTNRIFRLVLVLYASACADKTPAVTSTIVQDSTVKVNALSVNASAIDSIAAGKIIDPVICKSDPAQSYAVYIPAKGRTHALPVIYFFDSHGVGALPLDKYKSLADEYGFILIGSNNSKNGNDWPATEDIWRHLFDDTRDRIRIDGSRIYTCGFSGGAKVASYLALKYPDVKGVIANGAGLPDGSPSGDFNFNFTAITGEGDMNMTDLVSLDKDLDKSKTRHHIVLFEGKHEWAPQNSMGLAFAGLELDAMLKGIIPKSDLFINNYVAKSKKRLDTYYKTGQLIKAGQEYKLSISFLDGLTDKVAWFKTQAASLAANALYQKQLQAQENLLVREQDMKAQYMEHFQMPDMDYWNKTIAGLRVKSGAKTAEGGMNQRLLAYLSLAFYSISNHLINADQNIEARHFVELYKIADPSNSEAWYFSALLNARGNHAQSAQSDLLKAVTYGFIDEKRMMQQSEFQSLSPPIDFPEIQGRMRALQKGPANRP